MKSIEVLVVDHNISDIFLIRQAAAQEPCLPNIRVATNSFRARQMLAAKQVQPDLVVFDMNVANPSDLFLLESIDPYTPVVIFTSSWNATDRRIAMDLGVVEYIEKPADPAKLIAAASQIMRQWVVIPTL